MSSALTTFFRLVLFDFCFLFFTGVVEGFCFFSFSNVVFATPYSEARMSAGLVFHDGKESQVEVEVVTNLAREFCAFLTKLQLVMARPFIYE